MNFSVWKDVCIGSLYALSVLIYLCFGGVEVLGPSRWKEMLSLQTDGGDTTRLVVVISGITAKLENNMLYRLCGQSKFSDLCESWGQFILGDCFVR